MRQTLALHLHTQNFRPEGRSLFASARRCAFVAAVVLLAASAVGQSVPNAMNYQGRLTNNRGEPLETRDYTLAFTIHDAATGGSPIWGPQTLRVPVVDGYFNVVLEVADGGTPIAAAFTATNRYVAIQIDNRPAIEPRQRLISAPFAFQAQSAGYAQSAGAVNSGALVTTESGNVGIGTSSPLDKLEVRGDLRLAPGNRKILFSDDGNYDFNIVHNGGSSLEIRSPEYNGGTTIAQFFAGGNVTFPDGYVGIGTHSPASPLDVVGGMQLTGDQSAIRHQDTGGTLRFLTGLRSDVSPDLHFTFFSYGGGWYFPNANVGMGKAPGLNRLEVQGGAAFMAGHVGIGTQSPVDPLHVFHGDAPAIRLERPGFDTYRIGLLGKFFAMQNLTKGRFDLEIDNNGEATFTGAVSVGRLDQRSDREIKAGFQAIDAQAVLREVVKLPIQRWYFTNAPGVQHLGPVAQDFRAAFGLGKDDRHISAIDSDGVSLAAIQGLHQIVKERDEKIRVLEQRLGELESIVMKLTAAPRQGAVEENTKP